MPGGDGTGPMGAGAMTGRAAGLCAGYGTPGYANAVGGRGRGFWGRGCGGGRGRGLGFGLGRFGWAPTRSPIAPTAPTREQELETLKQQAADLQRRIEALGADATKETKT